VEKIVVMETVPVQKDEDHECPVPSSWRPRLRDIVGALEGGNFDLTGFPDVDPLDGSTAAGIARNIDDYGCTLAPLPEDSWVTSVCMWQEDFWEVLVDLFTVEEGPSDLVLHVNVFEDAGGFIFKVHHVYVP
jgi:hypothetical protein